jgi:peptidoglycan/xylan/chitin deacetylase (PgdA/CDA1 family)
MSFNSVKTLRIVSVASLVLLITAIPKGSTQAATNLLPNPSLEAGADPPTGWNKNFFGSLSAAFSISSVAHDGVRAAQVTISNRTSGSAFWYPNTLTVAPGQQYHFRQWYTSTTTSQLEVEYRKTASGTPSYKQLAYLPISSTYAPVDVTFTIPAGITKMLIYQFINTNGSLTIDDSLLEIVGTSTTTSTTTTVAPTTTTFPTTSVAPTTTAPPTTTIAPTTSVAPTTTIPPTTTVAPTTTAPPTTTIPASNDFNRALVSVEFDDGWYNAYVNGLPIVESLGLKTTANIITETALWNPPPYMIAAILKNVESRGHDVASHSVTHADLSTLSASLANTELQGSQAYLQTLLGHPVRNFVAPYCRSNATVRQLAKLYYDSLRECDTTVGNIKAGFDPYVLRARIVDDTTTAADIAGWVQAAQANKAWLILVYHEVSDSGPVSNASLTVTTANLQAQLQAVKNSGVTVLKTKDALAEVKGQL